MTAPEPHSPQQENTPPLLPYDPYDSAKDPRAIWLVPAYLGGLILAGGVYALVLPLIMKNDVRFKFDSPVDFVINAVAVTMVSVLFGAIGLGFGLWLKKRMFRYVRFARPRSAVIWGFGAGLIPGAIVRSYVSSEEGVLYWLLTEVVWNLVFATVAAGFLCRRSHVRG